MKEWFELLGYVLLGVAALIGIVLLTFVVLWFAAVIVALMIVLWAVGFRWKIYNKKRHIGYVRWFTFYPVAQ